MRVALSKDTANVFMNLVRCVLQSRLECTRPIAFQVGAMSDVCNTADSVEEDMSEFISNVSSSFFAMQNGKDLAKLEVSASGPLALSSLGGELAEVGVSVLDLGTDEVLHAMSSTPVVVYFRKATGRCTAEENELFLQSKGVDTSHLVMINSRHCPMKSITYEEVEETETQRVFNFEVETDGSITSEEAVKTALALVVQEVKTILS